MGDCSVLHSDVVFGVPSHFAQAVRERQAISRSGTSEESQTISNTDEKQSRKKSTREFRLDERIPRHAKAYRNFRKEYQRLQQERVAAFKDYADDVKSRRFPETHHLVNMDEAAFQQAIQAIEGNRA